MRIVIALGGNALGNNPLEQKKILKSNLPFIVDLIKMNHEIVITHGNGPQVGMINLAFEKSQNSIDVPTMPMAECTAMSQGYIGYHIETILKEILRENNLNKDVATILTEVEVNFQDQAFTNPTKPIGSFYTKEEVISLNKQNGYTYIEDAGRGYRRVIASPKPITINGINTINCLLKNNHIVIACGGGGIPISTSEVSAVIDKDLASSLLAQNIKADLFIILTNIKGAMLNYRTANEQLIEKINIEKIKQYIDNNNFAEGSMLPKVKACIEFTNNTGNKSIITNIENLTNALKEENCTIIYK